MQAFRMSGMGASFRPAGACPVMNGPHAAPGSERGFMVADAATADGTASARLVLWRCQFCGTLLTGIGRSDVPVGDGAPGTGAAGQEFTWLEENVPALASTAAGPALSERKTA
jgi:hypothetical protein